MGDGTVRRPPAAAIEQRSRSLRRHRTPAGGVRDAWRAAVEHQGWVRPEDWWHPSVEALARAIARRQDVRPAGTRLGHARARAGWELRRTVDDIFALYRRMPLAGPPSRLVRAVVEAWAEAVLAPTDVTLCGDPRRGSVTAGYLASLLGGVYQLGGEDGPPLSDEFIVLVVDVPPSAGGTGWEPVTLLLDLGPALLPVLPAHALVVTFSPGRVGTLVRRTEALPSVVADLAARLPDDGDTGSVVVTTEIPHDVPSAHRLLDRVATA
ncbi:hypothetical protein RB614_17035 [Phytohabitans sp. ZYX-F-186]|uniref:Uncharacterized protein n=1 Tax=Phytohabitans maris TaxID=3071409 RepID=A0ABU0ZII1_9ACTN|nr:hypothetical protein [Phytohabitans sp. ZYX-F-186]MDQ7906219.1 hypothetical protein [Phytohabitans sp. ZYX-F-186]